MGKTFLYKGEVATLFMEDEVEAALADGYIDHPVKEEKKEKPQHKGNSVQQKVLDEKEKFLNEKEKALDKKEDALDEKENFLEGIEQIIEEDKAKVAAMAGSGAVTQEQASK